MEGRWTLLLFLGAYLVLLAAEVRLITAQGIYTNTWAVRIEGGAEEAERIAQKHGFISHGQFAPLLAEERISSQQAVSVEMRVTVTLWYLAAGSRIFGFYDSNETVVEMEKQDWYLRDAFGLKTLNSKGAVVKYIVPGVQHTSWHSNQTVYSNCIEKWLT